MGNMIHDLLKQLGFNEKETTIYLAILGQGKATPADIAKVSQINRTTVYSVAKELIKKGVITEDLGTHSRYLMARPPEDLKNIAQKEEKQLAKKREIIDTTIQELGKFTKNTSYSIPKIVFIPEDDLENYLYKQAPKWSESIMKYDKNYWGFQDRYFVSHYEEWIDWFWEQQAPKDLVVKLLSNQSAEKIKEKKFTQRKIKFFGGGEDFTSTVWIAGDYVVMIVLNQRPHYLVEINDAVLAHNLRKVFQGIWKKVK
jgi:sugar-specific transcriptional regulator TrmB